jgi:beta-glucuronidase
MPGTGKQIVKVPSPKLWSPSNPHLHNLKLECGTDYYECRFGLRKIESCGNKLYLNNEPLKIIGVNRHDVFPNTGATVTKQQLYADLQMIKEAGFNTIRGSHYPQSQMMLDIADELGLLVWNEILGWENPIDSLTNLEFQRRQCDALTRMIKSSINHPCIIMWGFLNEGATNNIAARECVTNFYQTIKKLDASRLITFATMYGEQDLCLDLVDVISFNTYPGWYGGTHTYFEKSIVTSKLEELHAFVQNNSALKDKPVLISEIGAASFIGDHSNRRWSEEYHSQLVECVIKWILTNDVSSGVLLWQFCNTPVDDNIRIMMRPRGYNNKGLVDEFRNPKQVWKLFPDIIN